MKWKVRSTVIDWQAETMEITDLDGNRQTIPLDARITVTMVGFPNREQQTMRALNYFR